MTLTPAYGRDYKNKQAVLEAFLGNNDFILRQVGNRWDGKPINKSDLAATMTTVVKLRYDKLTKVIVLTLKEGKWTA